MDSEDTTDRPVRTIPRDANPAKFPTALAAQIGDRELWIANGGAVEPEHPAAMKLDPEYVISLNRTETEAPTDHCPLKDGYVNDQQQFSTAVGTTREHIRANGTVVVNCAAGLSRSSTVLATALAAENNVSFDTPVEEIKTARPRVCPHPKLKLNAYAYLIQRVDQPEDLELASQQAVRHALTSQGANSAHHKLKSRSLNFVSRGRILNTPARTT